MASGSCPGRIGFVSLALTLMACGGPTAVESTTTGEVPPAPLAEPIVVSNQGGDLEGHTPRGFAGSGTGLFAGDNLNEGFPDGEGIQILLTFELPPDAARAERAVLRSEALSVSGTPFDDLGDLVAEPVTYDEFGRELFSLTADGDGVRCDLIDETGIECDVSLPVAAALESRPERVQFRLAFEQCGDDDGEKDLARFFLTDPNTNEPGIFTLTLG